MQHTILLCGGSGQRLWPLSGEIRSKMFLNLLPAPDGGTESMLSRVCRQLTEAGLGESALFVTHKDQQALVRRYTGSTYPVIGEPYKRGTFTAAALECSIYVRQEKHSRRTRYAWLRLICLRTMISSSYSTVLPAC